MLVIILQLLAVRLAVDSLVAAEAAEEAAAGRICYN